MANIIDLHGLVTKPTHSEYGIHISDPKPRSIPGKGLRPTFPHFIANSSFLINIYSRFYFVGKEKNT